MNEEMKGLELFIVYLGMVMGGAGLAFAVVCLGLTPQFLTDQDCLALQNESFINGTQTGYQLGVVDTGNFVLETGQLPVFVNQSGVIEIQYLNLTEILTK